LKVLGHITDFVPIAKREFVSAVFITIHHDGNVFLKLLEEAREMGIAVRVVPQGFEFMPRILNNTTSGLSGFGLFRYGKPLRQSGKTAIRFVRGHDCHGRGLPAVAVIALLIKRDSAGRYFINPNAMDAAAIFSTLNIAIHPTDCAKCSS